MANYRKRTGERRGRSLLAGLAGLLLGALLLCAAAGAAGPGGEVTVLFTHDLHARFLPWETTQGQSGGYARLMTALEQERQDHPDALTVDGGDFSVGSVFSTLYTQYAPELQIMGAMGYDAATFGNHEFDQTGLGLARMLQAALSSGRTLPALLSANYRPDAQNPDQLDIQRAMAAYGVQEYLVLERGGVTFGLFGLMGEDAHSCAPTSGFALEDRVKAAQRCVSALEEEGAQFIICLSHGGTDGKAGKTEDEQLAKKVEGIDLIVSAHSHTTLAQPIVEGDTYIVSAGAYCQNLGSITFSQNEAGEKVLEDYRLIPIDQTLPEDEVIAGEVEKWKELVNSSYLSAFGLRCDDVLTPSSFFLDLPESGVQQGNALGELAADAFLWAAVELQADPPDVDTVAVTAAGVLRAPLAAGNITAAQAFDVLSMGVGEDGSAGYPLVSCYLTGKELKVVAEIDASVTPLMPAAQLYLSGMTYSFNTHRVPFDRVFETRLQFPLAGDDQEGVPAQIEDDRLYRVVSGMYSAQMLSTVQSKSLGLLSVVPKDELGQPITDFSQHVLRDEQGNEIKEWYALATYLQSFGEEGLAGRYAAPDGRKQVSTSWNPIELLKSPGPLTLIALVLLILGAALAAALVRWVLGSRRRRRYGGRRWLWRRR